jgi:hypothetical protein
MKAAVDKEIHVNISRLVLEKLFQGPVQMIEIESVIPSNSITVTC